MYYYFIILGNRFLFCNNTSITLLCTAKESIVKQTALNNVLHREYLSQLFYSSSIMLFLHIPLTNLKAIIHFSFVYIGDTLFSGQRDILSLGNLQAMVRCFLVIKCQWEDCLKSLWGVATPILLQRKMKPEIYKSMMKPQILPVQKYNTDFI